MVVKDGKIYFSLREIAPLSPYSADYLRIRILQQKFRGIKIGREWYTTQEWLAEYVSRYSTRAVRAAAQQEVTPIRFSSRPQFVPFAPPPPPVAALPAKVEPTAPLLVDIAPPLSKNVYELPTLPPVAAETAAEPESTAAAVPAAEWPRVARTPKERITWRREYRTLARSLGAHVPAKLALIPLVAALAFALASPGGAVLVPRERVAGALRSVGGAALTLADGIVETGRRAQAAAVVVSGWPEQAWRAVGDVAIQGRLPTRADINGYASRHLAIARGALASISAGNVLGAVRRLADNLTLQRIGGRLADLLGLSSPALTPPQANAPVRQAFVPRSQEAVSSEQAAADLDKQRRGTTAVSEVIETREVVRPADVSAFQAKLDELNTGLRAQVLKLVTDVANLYTVTDRKASIVTAFAPAERINQLRALAVDSGLTVRTGDLTASAGNLSVSGDARITGGASVDGSFSTGSLGTGGALTVSGTGTSTVSYGLTAATSGGLVGIGTTTPARLLSVGGDTYLTGGLGVGTATTSPGGLQTTGMAVIGSSLTVRGGATSTFAGPLDITGILTANSSTLTISSTSTVTTQFTVTRAPITAHTFAAWATGAANSAVTDASLLVNPASAAGDTNLFGLAVNGGARFLVDAEGDVYARNLILEGATTQASTTVAGTISIEGNATIGDAPNADVHSIRGQTTLLATTTPAAALTVWNSDSGDLLRLQSGTGQTNRFTFTAGGNLGIGSTTPAVGLSVATSTYITAGLGVGYATTGTGNLLVTELARFNSRVGISGTTSPVADLGVDGSAYITDGLGVGYATTSGLKVSGLGVFDNRLGIGTTSPVVELGNAGSTYLMGGLGLGFATTGAGQLHVTGGSTFEQELLVLGKIVNTSAGTSTFTGGLSSAGLASSAGLRVSSGDAILSGGLQVAGTATSSITGGLAVGSSSGGLSVANGLAITSGRLDASGVGVLTGSLGVGTSSPGTLLAVNGALLVNATSTFLGGINVGSISATGTLGFYTAGAAAPRLIIDASGNIGVATASPATTFSAAGSGYFTAGLGVGYATTGAGNLLVSDLAVIRGRLGISGTSSPSVELGLSGSAYLTGGLGVGFATTGTGNLYVTDLGVFRNRLGVGGTTSPTVELGVTGSASISGGLGVGYATTSGLKVSGLGVFDNRLGIGTTSPVVELGNAGSTYLVGGLGLGFATTGTGQLHVTGGSTFENELLVLGKIVNTSAGTSTFTGGLSSAGLASSAGLRVSSGDAILSGGLQVSGTATSSITGGLAVGSSSGGLSVANGLAITSGRLDASGVGVLAGSLGIATSSPGASLGVNGALLVNATSTFLGGLNVGSISATGTLGFYTAGALAPRMVIDSGGNVGIGTTSPGASLGVAGEGLFAGTVSATRFNATSSLASVFPVASSTSFSIADRLTVSGAGTSTFTGAVSAGGLALATSSPSALYLAAFGNRILFGGADATSTNIGAEDIRSHLRVSSLEILNACKGCPSGSPGGSDEQVQYNNGGAFGGATNLIYDDETGNVGVATTAPGTLLAVNGALLVNATSTFLGGINVGSISATGTLGFYTASAAAPRMVINSSGSVGIGGALATTSGLYIRTTSGGVTPGLVLSRSVENANDTMRIVWQAEDSAALEDASIDVIRIANNDADMFFRTRVSASRTAEQMRITSAGNVIITGNCSDAAGGGGCTADYAEVYHRNPEDFMEKTDILALNPQTGKVVRAESINQALLIGVFSSAPGSLIGQRKHAIELGVGKGVSAGLDPDEIPVAMVGRVPVKVSTESGPIKIGDRITSSSLAGTGMKATKDGITIGIALQDFSGENSTTTAEVELPAGSSTSNATVKTGKILVFVNLGYSKLDSEISGGAVASGDAWSVDPLTGRLKTAYALDLSGQDIVNVRSVLSQNGTWSISEHGTLVAKKVETEALTVRNPETARTGITIADRVTGATHCAFVANGAWQTEPGECGANAASVPPAPPPVATEVTTVTATTTEPITGTETAPAAPAPAPSDSTTQSTAEALPAS